ncbi:uncharacterized protein [Rutidosis leptorrhynchoides]|uniref:uncharacterized protein n=1 Tax=Rutidosis leptorrhynchoides TaxID=125765 RepID=UPI003A99BB18
MDNPFDALRNVNEEEDPNYLLINKDDLEQREVEPGNNETDIFMAKKKYSEGASTPGLDSLNANQYTQRRPLWRELEIHNRFVNGNPWVMMGDFNVSLNIEDSSVGTSRFTIAMREFQECVDNMHMVDINHMGFRYTWNQRPNAEVGLLKNIDRAMTNDAFISRYVDAYVIFQAYRISDHCPDILKFAQSGETKPKPFKFSNYIMDHEKFKQVVSYGWKVEIKGHMMF